MSRRACLGWILVGLALREAVRMCAIAAVGSSQAPTVPAPEAERWPNGLRLGGWPDHAPSLN